MLKQILLASILASPILPLAAEEWPSRPIKFVNPSSPGGGADTLVRWLANKVQPLAGVPVIVENKPGANANLATDVVLGTRPDGYTVLFNSSSSVIANRFVMKDVKHDAMHDLAPVASVFRMGLAFIAPPKTQANTLAEYIVELKLKKDRVLYGVPVVSVLGASTLFQQMTGTEGNRVAFKSMSEAVSSVAAGEIDFSFVDSTMGVGQAKAGRVKLLGVSPAERLASAPDVPTLSEAGLPGYEYVNFWAAWMPAKSPEAAVRKMEGWLTQVAGSPEGQQFFESQSVEPYPRDGATLTKMMVEHDALWVKLAKQANITPQ